jgi:hypothetical protein
MIVFSSVFGRTVRPTTSTSWKNIRNLRQCVPFEGLAGRATSSRPLDENDLRVRRLPAGSGGIRKSVRYMRRSRHRRPVRPRPQDADVAKELASWLASSGLHSRLLQVPFRIRLIYRRCRHAWLSSNALHCAKISSILGRFTSFVFS